MITTAVIIAGGEGSRLKPLTDAVPKAMVPLLGRPMLYWIIRWLKSNGISKLVVGVAHKKDVVVEYLRSAADFDIDLHISEHTLEGGTAQGFHRAIQRFVDADVFLAMNCDEITNLSVAGMEEIHTRHSPLMTMALSPFHCRFSVVNTNPEGMVSGFRYGHMLRDVLVSIGIYLFSRRIVEYIPETGSIENAVFSPLSDQSNVAAYTLGSAEEWISVNDVKDLREAESSLRRFYGITAV